MEDLWKQTFPFGMELDQLDLLYRYNWTFSNLEDAFEEGGVLHEKKVYLFGCTEPQLLPLGDQLEVALIPVVVAVVSPFPPSDKIGIACVQEGNEEIVDMKQMKMDWVPYIPLGKLKSEIFILSCVQSWAELKDLNKDLFKKLEYCLPYFYHPFKEDEQSTIANIMYPVEPEPVVCEFDWESDELEEFTDDLIKRQELFQDRKDAFKEFVKEKVREGKRANQEAREMRKNAREAMSEEEKAAYENIKFYKFYPVATLDTPDIENFKEKGSKDDVEGYFGKLAHVAILRRIGHNSAFPNDRILGKRKEK